MVLGSATAFSQQDFFVYLQADNHQLFYVRLNNKVYSSTESGYLIIPKLADSSYRAVWRLRVRWPKPGSLLGLA